MIQVLLLILKIIGITLLAILGLLLLILVLVLFVPIFYKVRIIHNPEKTQVKARASFLFPLLLVTFQYLKKISYKVRIFGFALLDSDKPKKEKKEKPPKKKKGKASSKKKKEDKIPETVAVPETPPETQPEILPEAEPEEKEETKQEEETVSHVENPKEKKQGFFEKIRCKIQKIRETIGAIISKISKLLHQKDEVLRILRKPETKTALSFAWDKLKRLLRHIFPRKLKGYVIYGADNPATTGQVLGICSVIYARTGQLLDIRPNFEEKQLECDVELKGRIQLFTLLVIAVKIFLNQELRQLIKEFQAIKDIE